MTHIASRGSAASVSIFLALFVFLIGFLTGGASIVQAQTPTKDLSDQSLEDLMNIEVTSVSKKEQKMSQVAAAIFVISQEDIRRSGATNIPDLLRMVPGLDVGQINVNTWAVSARGFNHELADKLLVLIDGRAVYTPINAGVNWDTQDVPLEDIERIEVIRGPGGTMWGANAVNGVINIITYKAADTLGTLVTGGGGTTTQALGTTQYGGTIGEKTSYRVFTKYLNDNHSPDLAGTEQEDDWHLLHGGFRTDTNFSNKDTLTVQGDTYTGSEGAVIAHIASIAPPVNVNIESLATLSGGNILSRWKHTFSDESDMTFQFYYDRYVRHGPENQEVRNTVDFDFQHHIGLGDRHDFIWGAGYRHSPDQTVGTIDLAFAPAAYTIDIFNLFAQDQITLKPDRVFFTIGSKLEHNPFTGFEAQPSIRLAWSPDNRETFWATVSRASRTPSRLDTASDINVAVFPGPNGFPADALLLGNPHQKSEHVIANELGYRSQVNQRFSIDIATFFNIYDHLRSREPENPVFEATPTPARWIFPIMWDNKMYGTTDGIEVFSDWRIANHWTLSPGYTLLQMHLHMKADSQDTTSAPDIEGSNPRHQAQLRSHVDLKHGLAWDVSTYFVDRLPAQQIPSYTRIDTQARWHFAQHFELGLVGQNLLRNHHPESNDIYTIVNSSEVKRNAYASLTWRFE